MLRKFLLTFALVTIGLAAVAAEPAKIWKSPDGKTHALGCTPKQHLLAAAPYHLQYEAYSRQDCIAQIKAGHGSLASFNFAILDQDGKPWCWAHGPTSALMVLMNILYGDQTILDPSVGPAVTRVYGGNSIDAMITQVQSPYGQPDAAFMGTDPPNAKLNTNLKSGWQAEAKKRIVPAGMWLDLSAAEEMASAIINGHPVTLGTDLPWGGHCICALEVTVASDGQSFLFAGPNSWGATWANDTGSYPGRAGWWQLTESTLKRGGAFAGNGLGSYALVGMIDSAVPGPGTLAAGPAKKKTVTRHGHAYHLQTAP
jgi:hypothetical protein